MRNIFWVEMKRAWNVSCMIGIIGIFFSICFDSWNDLIQALQIHRGNVHYFFFNSAWGGVCRTYFLPVFATFPFATSFCKEYSTHALPYIITREGKKNYCITKYIINALCGGLIVAIATALLFIVLSAIFPMTDVSCQGAVVSDRFHTWIAVHHPFQYGIIETVSGFLRGMIWASVSLCISLYISDPLVVMVSPYLFSFAFVQLCRILRIEDTYRLDMLLTGNMVIKSSNYTIGICTIASIAIVTILGIMFEKKVLRGLKDGKFY